MADDTTSSTPGSQRGPQGGQRPGGGREPGGFRIRLSDNEMRAAQAVQEAFRLRSTVAALGFSIRTLAQLLEEGKLDALVAEQRAQAGNRSDRRGGERGVERRGERASGPRIDPFARPSKPAAPQAEPVASSEPGTQPEVESAAAPEAGAAVLEPATEAEAEAEA